jgi:signal transduction histidine kinase
VSHLVRQHEALLLSVEAMGKQGRLTVRTRDAPGRVIIEVEDSGPGIPAEAREKIFTPFFTTKPEGTGLGLSISHSIVMAHGGELTFEDTVGRGTRFLVALPVAPASSSFHAQGS